MAYSKKTKEKFKELENEIIKKDEIIGDLEDVIQDLTIKYKYTQLDIEATRRELEFCKKLLEDKD